MFLSFHQYSLYIYIYIYIIICTTNDSEEERKNAKCVYIVLKCNNFFMFISYIY